jgi:hypothetical protein
MCDHALRRSGLLLALAVCQLSWSVPAANGQGLTADSPTATSNASAAVSAAEESPEVPIAIGIAPLKGDPTSRVMQAAPTVGNMTYHGGVVQHTQKVFTIFWSPAGYSFPGAYMNDLNQFVQDLNGSPYYAIASQYSDTVSNISTVVTHGGTWLDTVNGFPETALTYADLFNEVARAKAANSWISDSNSYFQVYTPLGISTAAFSSPVCGLHWEASTAIGQIIYPQDYGTSGTCFPGGNYPHYDVVDAAINTSAHEILETVTDPQAGGWFYVDGSGEIGDLCNFVFGTRAIDGSNLTLNGHKYLAQQLWSNAISGCALSYGGGPPAAATLVSPSGTISTNTPTYTWNAVTGTNAATFYYLWVQTGSGVIQQWYDASVCGSVTCSVTPTTPATGSVVTWWIRTWNSAGNGPWSSSLSFVPPQPPPMTTLVSPSGNISTSQPTYTWNKVTAATWYYVWVNNPSGTAVVTQWYDASGCGSTTCALTPSVSLPVGTSTWWVATWNNAGYGPWSSGMSFTVGVPLATTLISPTGSISTQTPTFTWNKVNSATFYYLTVRNAGGMYVDQTWYDASVVCSASTCSVTPATTLATGNNAWWVETWNSFGYGPWSAGLTFTTP